MPSIDPDGMAYAENNKPRIIVDATRANNMASAHSRVFLGLLAAAFFVKGNFQFMIQSLLNFDCGFIFLLQVRIKVKIQKPKFKNHATIILVLIYPHIKLLTFTFYL